ncbi:hypothetical protein [Mesorhizobium sp.]|uniref:hypothetical protein n=1 Tax=Mesorhizobium sp. TaxID=1871066 RepID=UPI001204133B|nr:hypothetical protein [Mesorhizobium sp.]TIL38515.1 MAG: hypothetical protein E5Y82_13515 [Mesorhizobium sp.]
MADNISIKDGAGATVVLASKDVGAVQYPKRIAVDGTGAEVAVATSALQTAGNTSLSTIATLGQGTMAQSMRVAVASDQADLPVKPGVSEAKITAATMPAGGVGFVGWLSAIWYQLTQGAIGIYNSTLPVLTTGLTSVLQLDPSGNLRVRLVGSSVSGTDAVANSALSSSQITSNTAEASLRPLIVAPFKFNGSTWERDRGTVEGVVLASAARTTAQSTDFVNYVPAVSLHVVINVTANAGAFSITPVIRARDPIATTEYYTLLTGAPIVANGRTVLKVGPGIAVAANASASDLVPRNLNFQMTVSDATSVTYSVAYVLA